jgi:hypothetical protein
VAAALTAVGTVWMARIAVRIYSNSILRTGPRISFRQAIKESRSALPGNVRVAIYGDFGRFRSASTKRGTRAAAAGPATVLSVA